ncbi:hypothetical protein pb186bvf_000155 [Paramecium bursaria]
MQKAGLLKSILSRETHTSYHRQRIKVNASTKSPSPEKPLTRQMSSRCIEDPMQQSLSIIHSLKNATSHPNLNNRMSIAISEQQSEPHIIKFVRKKSVIKDQEKFLVKQYWRSLLRWQGFDDYLYIRDHSELKFIKNRETQQKHDLVENLAHASGLMVPQHLKVDEKMEEQQRRLRYTQIKSVDPLFIKFDPVQYKQLFFIKQVVNEQHIEKLFDSILYENLAEVGKLCGLIIEKLAVEEIVTISIFGERLVRILWKMGILNFYISGILIHNLILEIYGRDKTSYSNWKKVIRLCNIQGLPCHKYKMMAYKHVSKTCIKIQQYDKAIIYLKKLLKLSWILNDSNFEIYSYDQIALCYYYKQEMDKAKFFHDKFSQGEHELPKTGMRNIGEQAYLLNVKLREAMIDQNSYSEDEFDLDILMQDGNMHKWENENKRKEINISISKTPVYYKQGHSFGKIHRPMNVIVDYKYARQKMHDFQKRQSTPLGPLFQKQEESLFEKLKKKKNNISDCQYLFNQKSVNRVPSNFLLQEELKDSQNMDQLCYKPQESIQHIKKLIKVFEYDLKYFCYNQNLFKNGIELI